MGARPKITLTFEKTTRTTFEIIDRYDTRLGMIMVALGLMDALGPSRGNDLVEVLAETSSNSKQAIHTEKWLMG